MSEYIPIETPGGLIWAEVEATVDSESLILTSIQGDALKTFEEATIALKANAKFLLGILHDLGPNEVEIEFGIKVGAEGGTPFFGLAKASGEASYTIKIKWQAEEGG